MTGFKKVIALSDMPLPGWVWVTVPRNIIYLDLKPSDVVTVFDPRLVPGYRHD